MMMPGFAAEASLYQTRHHYYRQFAATTKFTGTEVDYRGLVIPSLPPRGGGFIGFGGCISDCMDRRGCNDTDRNCRSECSRRCRDPGISESSSVSSLNNTLSAGGCWAWWAACTANPFTPKFLCDAVRDNCLNP